MQLAELEKAIRLALQGKAERPALAALAGDVTLPLEFGQATKTLAERGQKQEGKASFLSAVTSLWV